MSEMYTRAIARMQQLWEKVETLSVQVPEASPFARTLQRLQTRSVLSLPTDIDALIRNVAQQEGVDEGLLRAIVQVESGGNPRAVSPKGAMGLMQLMPRTASAMGVTDPFDPEQNLRGGARLIRGLLNEFGDARLALAAYNAGGPAVRRYGGIPPYAETQHFVKRVLELWQDER